MEKKRKRFGPGKRPGPVGISADDVRLAALELQRQGRLVGPVNVRLELGRGSYTTITRMLRELGFSAMSRDDKEEES